ncbi:MAG: hypothetical protein ACXVCA_09370, partial [Bdellovibrio sp.]
MLPKIEHPEDDKPGAKSKNFYGSQDPRGDTDHIDQVIDHAVFVAGTDILYEDWKTHTPEKRGELLNLVIEEEKKTQMRIGGNTLDMNDPFNSLANPYLAQHSLTHPLPHMSHLGHPTMGLVSPHT